MVQNTHKENEIEAAAERLHVVNGHLLEFNIQLPDFGSQSSLGQIARIGIYRHHQIGASVLHFQCIKASVAANLQDGTASKILRDAFLQSLPLNSGIVAQEMVRGGPFAGQIDVLKPITQFLDSLFYRLVFR